jgi:crotonobetainyl-CoA:carnitine CoA-transferase CaiB-like acyl-CoA transferase
MLQPLHGRVILDCSALLPGPFLGKLLRQQGARVLKLENPARPDGARSMGALFDDLNEDKEPVSIDIVAERARFHELVRKADGLIEGFRPEAKAKLGLDEKTLLGVNPRLCIASLVGYPEDGPWRDRAGHNLNFEAVTGCLSLFHEMPALPLADLFCAFEGALAMACAFDSVARGGPGRRVSISMSRSLEHVQSGLVRVYQSTGAVPRPGSTLFSGAFPCYRLYRAGDGRRVAVGAIEHKFWVKVCEILGVPELISEGYAAGPRGAEVVAKVQAAIGARPWSHWAPLFDRADCCVEPELDYSEAYPLGV